MKLRKYSASIVFLAFLLVIAVLFCALPKSAFSENEKRVLSDFPDITLESVADGSFGSKLETYLADQFPLRDLFVGIYSYTRLALGQNGVSGIYRGDDGYLIPAPEALNEALAARNVQRLALFAENAGLPASIMVVPNTGYVMEEKLPGNHENYPDDAIFQIVAANCGDLQLIDLRESFLAAKEQTQLYYKTDHHLTSAGSYLMYQQFCQQQGMEAENFSCTQISDGFYGTGYSQSGLWLEKPDVLEIWKSETPSACTATITEGNSAETADTLYFTEHLKKMDQYPVFLDGNHSVVTVENQDCQNGKHLLLLKDSYAHCFATFAIENYESITMVDMRYYRGSVHELIATHGSTEILYLYGAENLSTSTDIAWLMTEK